MISTVNVLSTYCVSICESLPFDSFFFRRRKHHDAGAGKQQRFCVLTFLEDAIVESEGLKQGIPYQKKCTVIILVLVVTA